MDDERLRAVKNLFDDLEKMVQQWRSLSRIENVEPSGRTAFNNCAETLKNELLRSDWIIRQDKVDWARDEIH